MGTENQNNRSTALTPEVLAMITATISAAVKEVAAANAEQQERLVKELALTPEKLREATKPYIDPAVANRQLREKMKFKQEEVENAKAQRLLRESCPHKYKNGRGLSLGIIRNYPDRQPRGICMQCHELIHPREWRIDAPTQAEPAGRAYVVPAHPLYQLVYDRINEQEG